MPATLRSENYTLFFDVDINENPTVYVEDAEIESIRINDEFDMILTLIRLDRFQH